MNDTTTALEICQFPGCGKPLEQPASGGPRKRFCCDQHRLQFWRLSRGEKNESRRQEALTSSGAGPVSPVLALRSQLEHSVHTLESLLTKARTTLLDMANLEEAEALRSEVFAAADEQVAKAHSERSAEERRRRAAENLAEAATSAAREAEEHAQQAQAEADQLRQELQQLREQFFSLQKTADDTARAHDLLVRQHEHTRHELHLSQEHVQALEHRLAQEGPLHRAELAAALERQDKTQQRLEQALQDLRAETELRARAEGQLLAQALRGDSAPTTSPKSRKSR